MALAVVGKLATVVDACVGLSAPDPGGRDVHHVITVVDDFLVAVGDKYSIIRGKIPGRQRLPGALVDLPVPSHRLYLLDDNGGHASGLRSLHVFYVCLNTAGFLRK